MREKLLALMKNENLSPSRLAELLGIQPSGVSHILGGRNKPSFDLIQKILRRFPQLNPDWLLLDKGPMYRETSPNQAEATPRPAADLFVKQPSPENTKSGDSPAGTMPNATDSVPGMDDAQSAYDRNLASQISTVVAAHGKVRRVIIFFEDRTFECYEA